MMEKRLTLWIYDLCLHQQDYFDSYQLFQNELVIWNKGAKHVLVFRSY